MKQVAIISEYDPFHNGHKYQTDRLREMGAECIVSILGGTFSQRGNCHIADKYCRARAAVASGGVDLALELPYPYSCSAAEYFARAGVKIASEFCDSIAFGCECDDPAILKEIASFVSSDEYKALLADMRTTEPEGSLPRLAEKIIRSSLSDIHASEAVLPNNILAIEYLRAVYEGGYKLEPVFIKRHGADHNSRFSKDNICSASLLREKIQNEDKWDAFCPAAAVNALSEARSAGRLAPSLENAERAVLYILRNASGESADTCAECGGGLGRRIINASSQASSLSELYSLLATKRYTNARIRRAIISLLIGTTDADEASAPTFTCLLAGSKKGLSLIKGSSFPVISTPSDLRTLDSQRMAELYITAEKISSLCYGKACPEYEFFTRRPYIFN